MVLVALVDSSHRTDSQWHQKRTPRSNRGNAAPTRYQSFDLAAALDQLGKLPLQIVQFGT